MTHDELLEKIELTLGTYISKYYGSKKDVELRSDVIGSLQALRAVVELHKSDWILPEIYLPPKPEPIAICTHCSDEQWRKSYPCPTIQAIEKELG